MNHNNFGQQPPPHLHPNMMQSNGNTGMVPTGPVGGGYIQNPGTPGGGYHSPGSAYMTPPPPQLHPIGIGNPRTPGGTSGGGMPMQNMNLNYNQIGQPIAINPNQYQQSLSLPPTQQQHSPVPPSAPMSTMLASQLSQQSTVASSQQNHNQGSGGELPLSNQQVPMQPQLQQQPNPQKELNVASFCRLGQETIQELVNKTNEMFGCLKATQPPDGKTFPQQAGLDRKQKLHEMLRAVKALMKRLRIIYDKMEEVFPSSDTMDNDVQNLIPYKQENEEQGFLIKMEIEENDRKNTEVYRVAMEEYQEVVEQVTIKNRHLKETIDHLRQIIWDVNTMLAMRKD